MAFTPSDVTITIGSGNNQIPVTGWATIPDFTIAKPKKRTVKTAIPVAGRSFAEYISYRLTKDNLGFVPIQDKWSASTHMGSHISSVIPESIDDLLVYFHELGHNKSKQPASANRGFFGGFSNCNATIDREYNAWVWALKYFRRLGYQMTDSCKELVKKAFKSYIDSAEDEGYASVKANRLSHLVGIEIKAKEKHTIDLSFNRLETFAGKYHNPMLTGKSSDFTWYDEFAKIPSIVIEKPKGWKPWHDLKQKQMKKSWRSQKMSTFGDGTFKQGVYEEIQWHVESHNLKPSEAISELMEIVQWMLTISDFEGEAYERGKEAAKAEILTRIS